MGKFIYTFRRYEKKYLLSQKQYERLMTVFSERMRPDAYGRTEICNLYCDTPDRLLIRRSLEKPLYKEKLRLRTYGVPKEDSTAFLEIKKKYQKIVYKRRLDLPYRAAMEYLQGGALPKVGQIPKEIDWFMKSYPGIAPSTALFYEREALIDREQPDLRVTFDSDLLWRTHDLDLTLGAYGNALLRPEQRLMEIKIPGAMPLWLAHLLSEESVFPLSYSKYGRAFCENLQCIK